MANEGALKPPQGSQLKISTGMDLGRLETRIQEDIARRAYELFGKRGRQHGGDLVDWFGAEEEIQRPADVAIREEGSVIEVKVQAPGFSANELEIGVSPHRIVIWGIKVDSGESSKSGVKGETGEFGAFLADVPLPSPVNPQTSAATFNNGWIEIHLTKEA